jgi:nucleoid-associated protein YgaU
MVAITVEPCYVSAAPRRSSAAVYARRRLVAGILLVLVLAATAVAVGRLVAALGDVPASVSEHRPTPAVVGSPANGDTEVYVVEPGDTLWSIARKLRPDGDVRSLIRHLAKVNGGTELAVGARLVVG